MFTEKLVAITVLQGKRNIDNTDTIVKQMRKLGTAITRLLRTIGKPNFLLLIKREMLSGVAISLSRFILMNILKRLF